MDGGKQRLDKWLFFARLQKSRTLAAKFVAAGTIRVNREKTDNPARGIKVGDVLTITFQTQVLVVRVEQPGTRRGPPAEARMLYTNLSSPSDPVLLLADLEPEDEGLDDDGDDSEG
ncbi:RNA-binding S4 domain-containing protein [Tianweitania sp. BSSL-BM11]|uniref:RNA-binding S4 domain-containing protein n=1 Tax=Tianweitania aestuarii TaxID=2814886 RepID=A0ABS5S322_9HYPH|nr:RNA-binding S4 domain-containing protein [Tianweitania aestuarii]MBS9722322.1 RNA-binding S4 domain-containing protein [Tianweitania aestuarii]